MKTNEAKPEFNPSLDAFITHFEAKGVTKLVSSQSYFFLLREMAIPIRDRLSPLDNIPQKYGIVDDDLERLAKDLAALLKKRLPSPTRARTNKPIVQTVEDLILFIFSCPDESD